MIKAMDKATTPADMKKLPLTITLEPDALKELENVANNNLRSRANQARIFIIEGLARLRQKPSNVSDHQDDDDIDVESEY